MGDFPAAVPSALSDGVAAHRGRVYIDPMSQESTRAGFVAIVGLPNAGKSSLLNQFLGSKLSIVTAAAQTTRQQVVGIDTRDGIQMIFLDTPGILDPAYLLHHSMLGIVAKTIAEADVVVLLLDGTRGPPNLPPDTVAALGRFADRLVVAINKTDIAPGERLPELAAWAAETFGREALEISAVTGRGIPELRARIAERLPISAFFYPEDDISSQNTRFFVEELIRETIFERYAEEVPYSTAVKVEEFRERDDPLYIRATIFVERATQKGILIGSRGAAIRDLGAESRMKIEEFLDSRVYLELWVKVLPRWRKNATELRRFGFPVPPELG
jgi:GTPase